MLHDLIPDMLLEIQLGPRSSRCLNTKANLFENKNLEQVLVVVFLHVESLFYDN
jgi:hypothetical protein